MITLKAGEVCPYGSFCEYAFDFLDTERRYCAGLDQNRTTPFVCELWAENYEITAPAELNNINIKNREKK